MSPEDFVAGVGAIAPFLTAWACGYCTARWQAARARRRRLARLQVACVDVLESLRRIDDELARITPAR